jgi:O-6-methylguanine DNA methyltransferase
MFTLNWFKHWDKIFWYAFVCMSAALIIGALASLVPFEFFIAFGFLMIIIGSGKLAEEISKYNMISYQNDTYKKMHQISQNLEKTFDLANMSRDKNEFRIQKLHESRKETEREFEKSYRDLARKVIEVENKMSMVSKALAERERKKPESGKFTFEEKVLSLARQVPRGKVITYTEIAKGAGKPRSQRNAGKILADNIYLKSVHPHRVIWSSGKIKGAGGMSATKRKTFLRKEGVKSDKKFRVDLDRYLFELISEV